MANNVLHESLFFPRTFQFQARPVCHGKCQNETYFDNSLEWTWQFQNGAEDFVELMNDARDVTFHRKHSSGTAVVRGTEPMTNDQYFWEIQMISPVYGTDMMVGVGTTDADVSQLRDRFISRLGIDNLTWGFSYNGTYHHNGEVRSISSYFDQWSVIGMHLDMWKGTLSFYKNRKHLGVAGTGLKGKTLYAMASSTAACSGMRILRTCSFPSSLQFLCCVKLRDLIPDGKSVLKELPLPPGLKQYLEKNLKWLLDQRLNEEHPCKEKNMWKTSSGFVRHDSFRVFNSFENISFSNRIRKHENAVALSESGVDCVSLRRENSSHQNYNPLMQSSSQVILELPATTGEQLMIEDLESPLQDFESDSSSGSETKRRKYSYNYAVGLSDPDTDSEL